MHTEVVATREGIDLGRPPDPSDSRLLGPTVVLEVSAKAHSNAVLQVAEHCRRSNCVGWFFGSISNARNQFLTQALLRSARSSCRQHAFVPMWICSKTYDSVFNLAVWKQCGAAAC